VTTLDTLKTQEDRFLHTLRTHGKSHCIITNKSLVARDESHILLIAIRPLAAFRALHFIPDQSRREKRLCVAKLNRRIENSLAFQAMNPT